MPLISVNPKDMHANFKSKQTEITLKAYKLYVRLASLPRFSISDEDHERRGSPEHMQDIHIIYMHCLSSFHLKSGTNRS
jgi:hypothetical protein